MVMWWLACSLLQGLLGLHVPKRAYFWELLPSASVTGPHPAWSTAAPQSLSVCMRELVVERPAGKGWLGHSWGSLLP